MIRRMAAVAALALCACAGHGPADAAAGPAARIELPALDLHDGQIIREGSTYYQYGTMYACGNPAGSRSFAWRVKNTPWCGFGVSTAKAVTGPWSAPAVLLSRWALDNWGADKGRAWNWVCGGPRGAGCFEPRMLVRGDGTDILWFTAPGDFLRGLGNSYYALGCNSLTGPCGYQAGGPHGSTHKPALSQCQSTDDDPGLFTAADGRVWLYCTSGGTLNVERLAGNETNGDGTGAADLLPGQLIESAGVRTLPDGSLELSDSGQRCAYCSGSRSVAGPVSVTDGHATAPAPAGPWTQRGQWAMPDGGQPDTIVMIGGSAYEYADLWTGSRTETTARVALYLLPGPFAG